MQPAQMLGTIGYEVLTSLGRALRARLHRGGLIRIRSQADRSAQYPSRFPPRADRELMRHESPKAPLLRLPELRRGL